MGLGNRNFCQFFVFYRFVVKYITGRRNRFRPYEVYILDQDQYPSRSVLILLIFFYFFIGRLNFDRFATEISFS